MRDRPDPAQLRRWADAYGGTIARWPDAARAAADRVAAEEPYRAILADAARTDAWLDTWTVPAPDAALRTRIVAGASCAAGHARRLRLWWSAIVGATALAGAAAGSIAAAADAPALHVPDAGETVFGNLGGVEP